MAEAMNLEVLNGTVYTVNVTSDVVGQYEVEVYKPAHTDDIYAENELVAHRYLDGNASKNQLENLIATIIANDKPSLVGFYEGGLIGSD